MAYSTWFRKNELRLPQLTRVMYAVWEKIGAELMKRDRSLMFIEFTRMQILSSDFFSQVLGLIRTEKLGSAGDGFFKVHEIVCGQIDTANCKRLG
jgi:hypothetical protein